MPSIDRTLSGDALFFHLPDELAVSDDADALARNGRTARTLIKDQSLRVTVHLLAPGGRIQEHHADGPITVQVLRGAMVMHAAGRSFEMREHDLLALAAGVVHSVESQEGAAFLLTISLASTGA